MFGGGDGGGECIKEAAEVLLHYVLGEYQETGHAFRLKYSTWSYLEIMYLIGIMAKNRQEISVYNAMAGNPQGEHRSTSRCYTFWLLLPIGGRRGPAGAWSLGQRVSRPGKKHLPHLQ